ncbi:MAG: polysaccharide biosynthesis protein, partial [Alicyclobacillus sp.]|nr:polysaccharide biosynthesis protein [Alicyclobacillus sp.]
PVYATLLAVATAGFPVAISKMVSEHLARGDVVAVRQTLRVAAWWLTAAGAAACFLLYGGAEVWAAWAGDVRAAAALRAIAPALLFVPLLSAWRGYFQGFQWMEPTAVSQVVEQAVRVVTILALAIWLVRSGAGEAAAAAGAAFGAVTGAAAGLLLLLYYAWMRHPHWPEATQARQWSATAIGRQLLYYALPISAGALVVPLMNNVDVVTVVNLLKHSGLQQTEATTQFGLLTGRAFKLMMLPTTLATGIGIAVMPAVSEAFTLGFRRLLDERVQLALRLTALVALPAAAGLALLALPLDMALFRDGAGTAAIQVMAVATAFASLQATSAAVLQGAGWVYLPVLNLLAGSGLKLLGNLCLVPAWGIRGAAAATAASYGLAALLNLRAIQHRLGGLGLMWLVRPALATLAMSGFVFALERQWQMWGGPSQARWQVAAAVCVMVAAGAVLYGLAAVAAGALTQRDLQAIPRVGPRLAVWCARWGLLRM